MPVEILLQQGDVADVKADVLLLKHAQGFHGADATVAAMLQQRGLCKEEEIRVAPGDARIIDTRGSQAAPAHVLFIGTPRLGQFRYREMESFASQAIKFIKESGLSVKSLSTTVHGAGYGLDVVEAFQSLLRGFERGLEQNRLESLTQIIFVERHPRRYELLAKALASLSSRHIGPTAANRPLPLKPQTPAKKKVFVAMPFSEDFEDVYQFGIYQVVRQFDFVCERVDESVVSGSIIDQIRDGIQTAEFVIADLSGERPNVYLEVGYAWGLERKVLLLAREGTKLHFDLSHHKCIFYKTIGKLAAELERAIRKMTGEAQ